jgi:hypothetical protein
VARRGAGGEDAAAFQRARARALGISSKKPPLRRLEEGQRARARYLADLAGLAELQKQITDHEKFPHGSGEAAAMREIEQAQLEREAAALRKQIDADQTGIAAAASDYQTALAAEGAASDVQADAVSYEPAGLTVTVKTPATRALLRLLDSQERLNQRRPPIGRQALYRAKATAAAATMAAFLVQAEAGRAAVGRAATKLKALHVTFDGTGNPSVADATGNPTNASLTPEQQAAYGALLSAASKYKADLAVIAQSRAELQLYASDLTEYGAAAGIAIARVNKVLSRVTVTDQAGQRGTLSLDPVAGIDDPDQARAALDDATQDSAFAATAWHSATALTAYNDALRRWQAIPETDKPARERAAMEVTRAWGVYEQASAYFD